AAVYFLVARASLYLAFADTNASPVWPPSGIAFAALLVFGARLWPGILLGAFAANVAAFLTHHGALTPGIVLASAVIGLGNSAEAVLSTALLKAWIRGKAFSDAVRSLKILVIFMGACAVAAGAGTAALGLAGLAPWALAPAIARTWWLGDATGILLLAPLLLSLAALDKGRPRPRVLMESALFLALLLGVAYLVFTRAGGFGGAQLMAYAITPLLILIAFRTHAVTAYLGLFLVSCISVLGTVAGWGPFSGAAVNEKL